MLYYSLPDPTGTSLLLVDTEGITRGHILYDGYGQALTSTLLATLTGALAGQGAIPDPDTGLVYLGAGRWYDPALGRPLQPNPAGGPPALPQALNRYAPTPWGPPGVAEGAVARGVPTILSTVGLSGLSAGGGLALTAYGTRLAAVDVGVLAIQSRRYSFLTEAGFSGRFRPFPSRKGVAVGSDAVQEWMGTVTALERGKILAAGGDDILATEFRKTGTTLLLDDARLARFLRSPGGEFAANFALNLALAVPDLISPWQNPYYNLQQKLVQNGITLGGVGAATGAALWVSSVATTAALGGPATFVVVTATGIVIFVAWEGLVKPAVSWTAPMFGLRDPYQEYRHLRPLGSEQ